MQRAEGFIQAAYSLDFIGSFTWGQRTISFKGVVYDLIEASRIDDAVLEFYTEDELMRTRGYILYVEKATLRFIFDDLVTNITAIGFHNLEDGEYTGEVEWRIE